MVSGCPDALGIIFSHYSQFAGRRRIGLSKILLGPQGPTGLPLNLLDIHARVGGTEDHLACDWIERENAQTGYHPAWSSSTQPHLFSPMRSVSIPRRGYKMDLGWETASFVIHDDNTTTRQGCDVGSPTAPWKSYPFPLLLHPVRVEVTKAVHLRPSNETQIHTSPLEQDHDIQDTSAIKGPRHVGWIAYHSGQNPSRANWSSRRRIHALRQKRPVPNHSVLEDTDGPWGIDFFFYEDFFPVADFAGRSYYHQFPRSVIHS